MDQGEVGKESKRKKEIQAASFEVTFRRTSTHWGQFSMTSSLKGMFMEVRRKPEDQE